MRTFFLVVFVLAAGQVWSQQWLSKDYDFTSETDVYYGASESFWGGLDSHYMNIYLPVCDDATQTSQRPLLMIIHGGAFLAGDHHDPSINNLCKEFAKRGFVTASISYRLGFISDDNAWSCNYPNYACVFASDAQEWERAYFRAQQDAKGALRYLVNRHEQYRIDYNNVFVAGESAGGFLAMAVAYLDNESEKPAGALAQSPAPLPVSSAMSCIYNTGASFSENTVARPDLGAIHGTIEPTNIPYTVKAAGNMFGGMLTNLLLSHPAGQSKPALYTFHRPCDLVVPIDSGKVYQGLSWCFNNGYGCYGIANTAKVYGSRVISTWNSTLNLGYQIEENFGTVEFPFSFLLGTGSCADQVNNPCHAYDNFSLRENNMAAFFASKITTSPVCIANYTSGHDLVSTKGVYRVFPNPVEQGLTIESLAPGCSYFEITDFVGRVIVSGKLESGLNRIDAANWPVGCLILSVHGLEAKTWMVLKK
jgi:alpha/beta superfamily hydrolase